MLAAGTSRTNDERSRLGGRGEALAATHLQGLGFRVLARNERTRHGEIDLIAYDGRTLLFAEVKTRRAHGRRPRPGSSPALGGEQRPLYPPALGWPAAHQRRRLRRLALAWLSDRERRRPWAPEIRFDVVRVIVDGGGRLLALEHVAGAL